MAGLESGQRADAREPGLSHYGRNDPGRGDLGPSPAGKGRFDCLGDRECGVHLGDGGQDGSGILPILLPGTCVPPLRAPSAAIPAGIPELSSGPPASADPGPGVRRPGGAAAPGVPRRPGRPTLRARRCRTVPGKLRQSARTGHPAQIAMARAAFSAAPSAGGDHSSGRGRNEHTAPAGIPGRAATVVRLPDRHCTGRGETVVTTGCTSCRARLRSTGGGRPHPPTGWLVARYRRAGLSR
jgi:hypothetical protein